jgi:hypothetical protein
MAVRDFWPKHGREAILVTGLFALGCCRQQCSLLRTVDECEVPVSPCLSSFRRRSCRNAVGFRVFRIVPIGELKLGLRAFLSLQLCVRVQKGDGGGIDAADRKANYLRGALKVLATKDNPTWFNTYLHPGNPD